MKRCIALFGAALLCACGQDASQEQAKRSLAYPEAKRGEQVDVYHGLTVPDPYRALENVDDPETKRWVNAENAVSQPWLEAIPAREGIKKRLTELWNYERYEVPVTRGGRYFYLRNDGLQNQSVLYVADSLDAEPRALLDPNALSKDATIALGEFVPSPDGKLLAYGLSDGGTDWRTWHVRDVGTGKDLPDTLRFIKFVEVAWTPDGRALYYARYPQRADGTGDDSTRRLIYRHRRGDPQEKDELIFEVTDHPTRNPYVQVTDDGRYAVFFIYETSEATGIYYRRLGRDGAPAGELVRLIDTFDADYRLIGEVNDVFYVLTSAHAPNGRVVAIPAAAKSRKEWKDVIAESAFSLIDATLVGGRIFAQYLQDAYSVVRVMGLDGKSLYDVKLPGRGKAEGFAGSVNDRETFFSYTDFLTPTQIFRLEVANGDTRVFRTPRIAATYDAFVTEQVFFKSKDGTRVPMFITHRRDLARDGQAPLLLYGYGGFSNAQQPAFDVPVFVWLELGGVYAVANIRGGSEYGLAWHSAGTKLQKQNVFDDFIAAAEWLIAQKYSSTPRLAIRGRSNGGLLVGAVMTQRPELFGAALPTVGVLDMLRYHTASSNARQWSYDYGLSENEDEFRAQYAYSPVHNVHEGTCYPPTLVMTAERDDRVVPWHSYKFAAALQRAQGCDNPILLRVETRAGHRDGKPVWMQIEDFADQWAFLTAVLHMTPRME
jgi:prolyl oligopeptidase